MIDGGNMMNTNTTFRTTIDGMIAALDSKGFNVENEEGRLIITNESDNEVVIEMTVDANDLFLTFMFRDDDEAMVEANEAFAKEVVEVVATVPGVNIAQQKYEKRGDGPFVYGQNLEENQRSGYPSR